LLPGAICCAVVGLWVGLRAARPGGGRFAAVPAAAALYAAAQLLTAGRADRYGEVAAAIVVLGTAGWLATEPDAAHRVRRWLIPVVAIGVCTALVAVLAPAAGAFEPRDLVSPPAPRDVVEPSPLPRLSAWGQQGDVELFRRTGPAARLHLVTLVDFDGESWRAAGGYRPIGTVQRPDLPPGRTRTAVSVSVTVSTLDGPWLPAPGVPTSVSVPDAGLDPDSGSLVLGGDLRPGLRYSVRGMEDTPSDADLAAAGVPDTARYLALPRPPYVFDEYAHRVVTGASTPFEQAVLIETAVLEDRRLDATAPAGSSYARLQTFLFEPTTVPGGQAGTSEQFATAFAVLARAVGLPTRVVVGFGAGDRQPDGTWVVHARDALAWPEVYFTGEGWVPFDPTPASDDSGGPTEDTKQQVLDRLGASPLPTPSAHPTLPVPVVVAPTSASPSPSAVAAAPIAWGPLARGAGLAAGGGVVLVLALLLTARTVRRARHRRAGPRGAWSEVLDLLVLLGRPAPRWHTAANTAAELAHRVPVASQPATRLAELADRAAFAPDPTPTAEAWPLLRTLRRSVRRSVPVYRRLTWPLDPRPLRRRR
jgi:transglutaminase-like putative cysteine protease